MILPHYLNPKNKFYKKFGEKIASVRKIPPRNYTRIIPKLPKKREPIIFLEPHSDDIALSISGTLFDLYKKGHEIIIYSFFTFSPRNKSPLEKYLKFNESEYEKLRMIENISAFNDLLCCKLKFLNLKSSKFRGYKRFYQKLKKEDSAIKDIKKILRVINKEYPSSQVFIPGGIGNHVDHIIIRDLALKYLFNPLFMYEDYPYCLDLKYYDQGVMRIKALGGRALLKKIKIKTKTDLINLYNTQFSDKYNDKILEIRKNFRRKDLEGHYERYWKL